MSIAQRSRRSQRGIEAGRRKVIWWSVWFLGEKDALRGEHRTEVTEATEEGLRIEAGRRKVIWWTVWFLGEKDALRGEHRTEVTEVTEGGLRLGGGRLFGGLFGFWVRKTRFGESIARRSRRVFEPGAP